MHRVRGRGVLALPAKSVLVLEPTGDARGTPEARQQLQRGTGEPCRGAAVPGRDHGRQHHREADVPAERQGADGRGPRAHEAARGPGQGDTPPARADVRAPGGAKDTPEAARRSEEAQHPGTRAHQARCRRHLRSRHQGHRGLAPAGLSRVI